MPGGHPVAVERFRRSVCRLRLDSALSKSSEERD
jgi:hypothetical protein